MRGHTVAELITLSEKDLEEVSETILHTVVGTIEARMENMIKLTGKETRRNLPTLLALHMFFTALLDRATHSIYGTASSYEAVTGKDIHTRTRYRRDGSPVDGTRRLS